MNNMQHLESIVARLPEAERVDIEAWGNHPSFRVRGKNFVFCDDEANHLSVKLSHEEATAVLATDPTTRPEGYGLGRHGWIAVTIDSDSDDDRWQQITEWVRTSYTLVAPSETGSHRSRRGQPMIWPCLRGSVSGHRPAGRF